MTNEQSWILIATETTGFTKPIFAVELAAQKMQGWKKVGASFRYLLNLDCVIPPEASRYNRYTREILDRDGSPPEDVYQEFAAYVGNLPVVAYNMEYDWDKVLMPEWKRLSIPQIGVPGFCALKLAQRLLDPAPAGNCKLQTLRQYNRLQENGAHTAIRDVMTVIDLMQQATPGKRLKHRITLLFRKPQPTTPISSDNRSIQRTHSSEWYEFSAMNRTERSEGGSDHAYERAARVQN